MIGVDPVARLGALLLPLAGCAVHDELAASATCVPQAHLHRTSTLN